MEAQLTTPAHLDASYFQQPHHVSHAQHVVVAGAADLGGRAGVSAA